MVRRHGWQLPAHTFQVVAITVFFLLSIAFYAFFAPFLGKDLYEYVAIAVYSFLAFCVFVLYVRCTAIDPADPGVLIGYNEAAAHVSQRDAHSLEEPSRMELKTAGENDKHDSLGCSYIGCFFCAILAKEDCRKDEATTEHQTNNDDALFCTLCNVEVRQLSKHCRSCDKCVDGFDHHCRWLNNCVGRKNYITFLCLMAMSLAWVVYVASPDAKSFSSLLHKLAVESGVGISVLVRSFTNKREVEFQIIERLGDGFSRAPFVTVVAMCTALSLLASVPLGELFFFHMILIRKGITTYEYVVAMRAQTEPPGPSVNEDHQSLPSSPASSAPTARSGSSLGLQYRGSWCTPPRIFVDRQDETIPHLEQGRAPSTVDPDAVDISGQGKRASKQPVQISAWKLAKLDKNEAKRAAAKARASSSVLKPIGSRMQYETDRYSSGNASSRSSTVNSDMGHRNDRVVSARSSPPKSSYPPSRASREDLDTYPQTPSSLSSPHHRANTWNLTPASQQQPSNAKHADPMCQSSADRALRSIQSNEAQGGLLPVPSSNLGQAKKTSANSSGSSRSSVYWDPEVGRFVSSQSIVGSSSRSSQTELQYSEPSIFFGGPMLGEGPSRSSRNTNTSYSRRGGGGADRGRGPNQLPIFVPKEYQQDQPPRFH